MLKKKWICRIIGHKDRYPEEIYEPLVCEYCGECDCYDHPLYDPWHIDALRGLRFLIKVRWWRFRSSVQCEHCKKLFGRHNDAVDHDPMPF